MAQSSGPIAQGTTAERQFTDVLWRDIFGDEAGVLGDYDGTSYKLALSTNSDVVSVGSSTQRSLARVAGFGHAIPTGTPEGITIPAASGTTRTDIIALRYDPAYTGLPGPVRLFRIAGTSAAIPAYDAAPPGVEDLPLWAITRKPGEALSQATTIRLFNRIAPMLDVPPNVALPTSAPLGTLARYGTQSFRRELGNAQVPVWVADIIPLKSRFVLPTASGKLAGTTPLMPAQTLPAAPFGAGRNYRYEVSARTKITAPQGFGARLELLLNGVVFGGVEYTNGGPQTVAFKTLEVNDIAYITNNSAQTLSARLTSLGGEITVSTQYGRFYVEAQPNELF